ncbi:MAG TPA: xanthine dehydrogenase family protein subunit M, partial [Anaerolineae bacterium]|nr:xanthine dehydrogenase family protein subunit M [Anaerolineae bacterium]
TDLIPEIKSGIAAPTRLVNLKGIDGLRGIVVQDDAVQIGALTRLAEIVEHETIRTNYRALAQACELAASPQIRNMATIGGNLCQDSRCPYYRSGFHCFLRGGDTCFMREGENREAAIVGYKDCVHVHPSDPATALVAFDAQVVIQSQDGERMISASEFFRAPDAQDRRMNVLEDDEVITAIRLPRIGSNSQSAFVKAMDRAVWSFALASAAVRVEIENEQVSDARVVLGGVAPTPWRETGMERALLGTRAASDGWDEEQLNQLTANALAEVQPLAHNRYKVRLARAMMKRALRECLA